MKLVKFKDGTYGVRRLDLFRYTYKDLSSPRLWWDVSSRFFPDCKGTREQAERAFHDITDKGTPIEL